MSCCNYRKKKINLKYVSKNLLNECKACRIYICKCSSNIFYFIIRKSNLCRCGKNSSLVAFIFSLTVICLNILLSKFHLLAKLCLFTTTNKLVIWCKHWSRIITTLHRVKTAAKQHSSKFQAQVFVFNLTSKCSFFHAVCETKILFVSQMWSSCSVFFFAVCFTLLRACYQDFQIWIYNFYRLNCVYLCIYKCFKIIIYTVSNFQPASVESLDASMPVFMK